MNADRHIKRVNSCQQPTEVSAIDATAVAKLAGNEATSPIHRHRRKTKCDFLAFIRERD
jgi:hypothetical protein